MKVTFRTLSLGAPLLHLCSVDSGGVLFVYDL